MIAVKGSLVGYSSASPAEAWAEQAMSWDWKTLSMQVRVVRSSVKGSASKPCEIPPSRRVASWQRVELLVGYDLGMQSSQGVRGEI